jgi:hypothetical protein
MLSMARSRPIGGKASGATRTPPKQPRVIDQAKAAARRNPTMAHATKQARA